VLSNDDLLRQPLYIDCCTYHLDESIDKIEIKYAELICSELDIYGQLGTRSSDPVFVLNFHSCSFLGMKVLSSHTLESWESFMYCFSI
jgi:hypothetical protein